MRISEEYKVREMAGEHVIVMPGRYGVDMTRVVALNDSSLYLWNALRQREFSVEDVAGLLFTHYRVDDTTARRDAAAWCEKLAGCGILEK